MEDRRSESSRLGRTSSAHIRSTSAAPLQINRCLSVPTSAPPAFLPIARRTRIDLPTVVHIRRVVIHRISYPRILPPPLFLRPYAGAEGPHVLIHDRCAGSENADSSMTSGARCVDSESGSTGMPAATSGAPPLAAHISTSPPPPMIARVRGYKPLRDTSEDDGGDENGTGGADVGPASSEHGWRLPRLLSSSPPAKKTTAETMGKTTAETKTERACGTG
ncbi:hypothetical protein B0H13DRAFT_2650193 [Mycena leptocephala]|nr:hypothetical protein B0H13DRAFT_2650193 [Mycena leptocephala]